MFDIDAIENTKNSPFFHELIPHDFLTTVSSPMCGDELTIYLRRYPNPFEVEALPSYALPSHALPSQEAAYVASYLGKSCLVSRMSADMMMALIQNTSPSTMRKLVRDFAQAQPFENKSADAANRSEGAIHRPEFKTFWSDLQKYPTRFKCAMLPWNGLEQLLTSIP